MFSAIEFGSWYRIKVSDGSSHNAIIKNLVFTADGDVIALICSDNRIFNWLNVISLTKLEPRVHNKISDDPYSFSIIK